MSSNYNIKSSIVQGCAAYGLQDLALWQCLVNMCSERCEAAGISDISFPQDGSNIQSNPAYYIKEMQTAIMSMVNSRMWTDYTQTASIEGYAAYTFYVPTSPLVLYQFPTLRTLAGATVTNNDASSIANNMFVRFKPRTITSNSDTTDVDGNTCASGMYAQNTGDNGNVYNCTGSGVWTLTTSNAADVLNNFSAAPNAIAGDSGNGIIQAGDYIQWETLEDIRLCLNQFRETWYGTYDYSSYHPPLSVGMAATQKAVGAITTGTYTEPSLPAWSTATTYTGSGSSVGNLPFSYTGTVSPTTRTLAEVFWNWNINATTKQTVCTVTTANIATNVRWLGKSISNSFNENSNDDYTVVLPIDAQGCSVGTVNTYHVWQTTSGSGTTQTYQYASVAGAPPDQAAWIWIDSGTSFGFMNQQNLGFEVKDIVALVNYFDGFQYQF